LSIKIQKKCLIQFSQIISSWIFIISANINQKKILLICYKINGSLLYSIYAHNIEV
jgi:hypothetical protein